MSHHRNDKHFKLEINALVFPDADPPGGKAVKMKGNLIGDKIFYLAHACY